MEYSALIEKLKQARNEKKLLQSELASILGVTQSTLSKYEQGNLVVCSDFLLKWAKEVGLEVKLGFPAREAA